MISRKTSAILVGLFLSGIAVFLWRNQFMNYDFSVDGEIMSRDGLSSLGKGLEEQGMLKELGEALKELDSIDWSKFSTSTEDIGVDSETTTFDLYSTTTTDYHISTSTVESDIGTTTIQF